MRKQRQAKNQNYLKEIAMNFGAYFLSLLVAALVLYLSYALGTLMH